MFPFFLFLVFNFVCFVGHRVLMVVMVPSAPSALILPPYSIFIPKLFTKNAHKSAVSAIFLPVGLPPP